MAKLAIALAAVAATLGLTTGASARVVAGSTATAAAAHATLVVDNDKKDCPNAQYRTIRGAIGDAVDGDTIFVCAGTYAEGPGTPGSSALIIQKSLTLKGAGADVVTVEPKRVGENRIASDTPSLRDGEGDIVSVGGQVNDPVTVDISGITFDGNGVDVTAGIVFRDAGGSVKRSHVTGLVTDMSKNGYQVPGGFRSSNFGVGIAIVTRNTPPKNKPKVRPTRTVTIDETRIDDYNPVGVLVDGSTGNSVPTQTAPLVESGIDNRAVITNSQIIGRNSCQSYNDFSVGDPTATTLAAAAAAGDTTVKLASTSS